MTFYDSNMHYRINGCTLVGPLVDALMGYFIEIYQKDRISKTILSDCYEFTTPLGCIHNPIRKCIFALTENATCELKKTSSMIP